MFSDSVYIDRVSRMPTVMEMPYNEIVRKFIDMYAGRLRNHVAFMLSACNFYMPIFEEALDAYGLPLELKYLPIIESALNPSAVSRAGACGLWQFMLATGKIYGLESNSLVDERRDPIKATWAAARYLKDMYDIYKDWNLVIAAYNCGPGTINKAIRRSGGKTDYWEIYNYLPKETRGYVPAFIAANYVMTYYCKHNICPMETDIPEATDTVQVSRNLHFEEISDLCGISLDQIKSLNPQFKKSIIPGESKPQTLRLPINYISAFIDKQDTIYAHRSNELFKNRTSRGRFPNTRSMARSSKGSTATGECHLPQDTQWRESRQHCTEIRCHCQSVKKLEWIAQYQNLRRKALEDFINKDINACPVLKLLIFAKSEVKKEKAVYGRKYKSEGKGKSRRGND